MGEEEKKEGIQTEEKTYSERQFKGLLSDKQRAVERAQQLEAKIAAIETQYDSKIKDLESQINQKEEDLDLGDPEDVVNNATLKKLIKSLKSELAETKKEMKNMKDAYLGEKQSEKEKQAEKSVEKARQKYSKEKVGEGMTFDEVLEGTRRMCKENKMYEHAIAADKDPGELMYKIGLMDPTIAKRAEAYQGSLPVGGVTPKTNLKGTTKPAGFLPQKYVQEQAKKDPGFIKAHLKEIKESQKYWNKDDK